MTNKEKEAAKNTYKKPELRQEGQLKDITAAGSMTQIDPPD
jgi:hypothetical protein